MARIKRAATPGFDPEVLIDELTRVINWESKKKSFFVLLVYLLFVWFFQPWMLTFALLLPFIYNLALQAVTGLKSQHTLGKDMSRKNSDDEDPEEEVGETNLTSDGTSIVPIIVTVCLIILVGGP